MMLLVMESIPDEDACRVCLGTGLGREHYDPETGRHDGEECWHCLGSGEEPEDPFDPEEHPEPPVLVEARAAFLEAAFHDVIPEPEEAV